ncbi:unnamed protein product [Cylicostephanus goldi]|uniref:Uncharacterized protein n=1 Tax=Cylicostephanus goldi TaxID=71465 RepID=A0A3P6R647_CYLGO|nr:unnamed protein product [Cylicostephanus goldi]
MSAMLRHQLVCRSSTNLAYWPCQRRRNPKTESKECPSVSLRLWNSCGVTSACRTSTGNLVNFFVLQFCK